MCFRRQWCQVWLWVELLLCPFLLFFFRPNHRKKKDTYARNWRLTQHFCAAEGKNNTTVVRCRWWRVRFESQELDLIYFHVESTLYYAKTSAGLFVQLYMAVVKVRD